MAYLHVDVIERYAKCADAHAEALANLVDLWTELRHPDRANKARRTLTKTTRIAPGPRSKLKTACTPERSARLRRREEPSERGIPLPRSEEISRSTQNDGSPRTAKPRLGRACCLGLLRLPAAIAPQPRQPSESQLAAAGPPPTVRAEVPVRGDRRRARRTRCGGSTIRWVGSTCRSSWGFPSCCRAGGDERAGIAPREHRSRRPGGRIAAHLDDQCFQEAYDLAKHDDSFLGHVLAAGMAKVSGGYEAASQAMQEVGDEGQPQIAAPGRLPGPDRSDRPAAWACSAASRE